MNTISEKKIRERAEEIKKEFYVEELPESIEKLLEDACFCHARHKLQLLREKGKMSENDSIDDWFPNPLSSKVSFLVRITLNYVRHEKSNYEEILAKTKQLCQVDNKRLYQFTQELFEKEVNDIYFPGLSYGILDYKEGTPHDSFYNKIRKLLSNSTLPPVLRESPIGKKPTLMKPPVR